MLSSRKVVTFQHPFNFVGLDGTQPAGNYVVVTDEEEIPGLSFVSWRRVGTSLRLPAVGLNTGLEQVISVNPQDLAEALEKDAYRSV